MILILGGKGFVGSAFARYCERSGLPYLVVDREEYAGAVGRTCEVLINVDGNSHKPLATRAPLEDFDATVRSVRASLVDFRCRKYVMISSCDVYPDCSSPRTTPESEPLDPAQQSPYGFHKYLAEQCVRHGAEDWLIFRCGGFIGPGLKKNAIYDLLHGGPLFLDPASELQYLPTDRAAEIVFQVLATGVRKEVFNLCGKGTVQIAEVARLVPGAVPVRPDSPRVRYEINLEKISALVDLPETRASVLEFVRAELAKRGGAA